LKSKYRYIYSSKKYLSIIYQRLIIVQYLGCFPYKEVTTHNLIKLCMIISMHVSGYFLEMLKLTYRVVTRYWCHIHFNHCVGHFGAVYDWNTTKMKYRNWQMQSHWNQWRISTSGCEACVWRHDKMCRSSCCCGSKQTHTGVHTSFYFRHKYFGI
jgi:hypothetical protein